MMKLLKKLKIIYHDLKSEVNNLLEFFDKRCKTHISSKKPPLMLIGQ